MSNLWIESTLVSLCFVYLQKKTNPKTKKNITFLIHYEKQIKKFRVKYLLAYPSLLLAYPSLFSHANNQDYLSFLFFKNVYVLHTNLSYRVLVHVVRYSNENPKSGL